MGFQWNSNGMLWICNESPMDYQWICHGFTMDFNAITMDVQYNTASIRAIRRCCFERQPAMAWSDNVLAFAPSIDALAAVLACIALLLMQRFLLIKDGSCEIVPACTRRHQGEHLHIGPILYS